MHNYLKQIKALPLCLALVLPISFALAPTHNLEAKDAENIAIVKQKDSKSVTRSKQEQKDVKVKTADKQKPKNAKDKNSHKKHNKNEQHNKEEENKTTEIKPVETPPPTPPTPPVPPHPVTPDKKKYASPGGNQIMTDGSIIDFQSVGVIFMHGYRYSYYSSNVLRHHRTHEWYACDDHLYRTADGYIVVASKDHPLGAIVPTPFGQGKVMDRCYVSGTLDIYVDF